MLVIFPFKSYFHNYTRLAAAVPVWLYPSIYLFFLWRQRSTIFAWIYFYLHRFNDMPIGTIIFIVSVFSTVFNNKIRFLLFR